MNDFKYLMPAKVFFGENCIVKNAEEFKNIGKKAMIFTGRSSAKKNGSLDDVKKALDKCEIKYVVFDEVEENPSVETAEKAAKIAVSEGVDFVVGIGGGSPMDAAKAAAILIKNPDMPSEECLFSDEYKDRVPVVEVPTTAGTGSEVTQYSVVTLHSKKTKSGIKQHVFAEIAFLDARYMSGLSDTVTINTAIDALSHLIEGYMCKNASFMSDKFAEMGFSTFAECIDSIRKKSFTLEIREKLLISSTIAGIVIAQTSTSLPHAMGYALTYNRKIPHGRANGILTTAYLELFPDQTKVKKLTSILGLNDLAGLDSFMKEVLDKREEFTEKEVEEFTEDMMQNSAKLASHPYALTREQVYEVYRKSLLL